MPAGYRVDGSRQPLSIRDKIRYMRPNNRQIFSFCPTAGYRVGGGLPTAGSSQPTLIYQLIAFARPGLAPGSGWQPFIYKVAYIGQKSRARYVPLIGWLIGRRRLQPTRPEQRSDESHVKGTYLPGLGWPKLKTSIAPRALLASPRKGRRCAPFGRISRSAPSHGSK